MKRYYTLLFLALPLFSLAQVKEIAFAELTPGSGMYFGAEMTTTTITVTVQGPADRFLAFGFGTGMGTGNDAIIWSTLGTGAAPLQLRDHRMIGSGNEPSVDAQQDWSVISNNVVGANRTIVASRALSTGDANDVTFNFAATTQNLFWAKGPSASNQLQYHGGNRASGIVRNWVLADIIPPTVNSFSPADNANQVSLTANLLINFNENVQFGAGSITLYDESNNVVQTVSSGSPGLSISGSTVLFNPSANFVQNMDYYVHVDPTAITDMEGNAFAGFTDNTTWNFNTNDITAPVLATVNPLSPADNSSGAALTTNLTATFNENIQAGTGVIELFDGGGTLIESFDVATSPQVSFAAATVTINPTADLVINTNYYVHIAATAVTDLSGNAYLGISSNTAWNFNTNEAVAPSLLGTSPADNAMGVALGTNLVLTFDEPVQINASMVLSIRLHESGGTLVESFASAHPGISVAGNVVTIDITGNLDESTGYYVLIDNGLIGDLIGNNYAGISDNTAWSFTTGDFTAPELVAPFAPADNATNVPQNTALVITFNEPIAAETGFITLVDESGVSPDEQFDVATSSAVNISGSTVTITPASELLPETNYHVVIDAGAIEDLASNTFAGISDTTAWNFETALNVGLTELENAGISWDGTILKLKPGSSVKATLLDASGKIVRVNLQPVTDCSDLPTGIYFVGLESETATQTVRIYVH